MANASQTTSDFKGDHLRIQMFGGVGDCIFNFTTGLWEGTDNTPALNAAIYTLVPVGVPTLAPRSPQLYFPAGLYLFKSQPNPITGGLVLVGDGASSNHTGCGTQLLVDYNAASDTEPFLRWDGSVQSIGGGARHMYIFTTRTGGIALNPYAISNGTRPGEMYFEDVWVAGVAVFTTTLVGNITAGDLTLTLASPNIQDGEFLLIDAEMLRVTAGGGTVSLTVTRGVLGQPAASHTSGVTVQRTGSFYEAMRIDGSNALAAGSPGLRSGIINGCAFGTSRHEWVGLNLINANFWKVQGLHVFYSFGGHVNTGVLVTGTGPGPGVGWSLDTFFTGISCGGKVVIDYGAGVGVDGLAYHAEITSNADGCHFHGPITGYYSNKGENSTITNTIGPDGPGPGYHIPVTLPPQQLPLLFKNGAMGGYYSPIKVGYLGEGTVQTDGTAVMLLNGDEFDPTWGGFAINIDGTVYTIASVMDGANLVLTASAGVLARVGYFMVKVAGTARGVNLMDSGSVGGVQYDPTTTDVVILSADEATTVASFDTTTGHNPAARVGRRGTGNNGYLGIMTLERVAGVDNYIAFSREGTIEDTNPAWFLGNSTSGAFILMALITAGYRVILGVDPLTGTFGWLTDGGAGKFAIGANATGATERVQITGGELVDELHITIALTLDPGTTVTGLVLPNIGTPGTYEKVTTDAQGRVTVGAALVAGDIPDLSATYALAGTSGSYAKVALVNQTASIGATNVQHSSAVLSAGDYAVYVRCDVSPTGAVNLIGSISWRDDRGITGTGNFGPGGTTAAETSSAIFSINTDGVVNLTFSTTLTGTASYNVTVSVVKL